MLTVYIVLPAAPDLPPPWDATDLPDWGDLAASHTDSGPVCESDATELWKKLAPQVLELFSLGEGPLADAGTASCASPGPPQHVTWEMLMRPTSTSDLASSAVRFRYYLLMQALS